MTLGQKPFGPLRSYGRVKSRAVKPRQAALMDARLPDLSLDLAQPLELAALKPDAGEVWLEVGFGGGEHLTAQAARRPDVLTIGAEPFVNGVASCIAHIEALGLTNVRLLHGDVRDLLPLLPDASVARIFVLFPDPWPKARHHKRRLVQDETLAAFARVLKPGGRLRLATDWADYADWILERVLRTPGLAWIAERAGDWRERPVDHVVTRYEEKRLGDCAPIFIEAQRL